jgi:hypothetical protein
MAGNRPAVEQALTLPVVGAQAGSLPSGPGQELLRTIGDLPGWAVSVASPATECGRYRNGTVRTPPG